MVVAALGLALPSYGQEPGDVVIGFTDRLRIALALLLQALGGGFEVAGAGDPMFGSGGSPGEELDAVGALSVVPLTVTGLWIAALLIGVRILRNRLAARAARDTTALNATPQGTTPQGTNPQGATAGLEAAVRVALLVTAAVLVLGLFAQPTVAGTVEVSSSPVLAALGALLLSLAVGVGVLHRDDLAEWLAVRPVARALFRATGTAVRALAVVLALCSLVAFVVLAQIDGLDDALDLDDAGVPALLLALLLLPNLAVTAAALAWGAPVEAEVGGSSTYGGGYEHESFGFAELGDAAGAWAVVGAIALGLVCALTVGIMAARRSADRREQMLAAGVFFSLFLLLAGVGGIGAEGSGGSSDFGASGAGTFSVGPSVPDALLFGLLWIFAAAFVAPYAMQMSGVRTGLIAPPIPPMPSAPAGHAEAPATPQPQTPAQPQTPPQPQPQPQPQSQAEQQDSLPPRPQAEPQAPMPPQPLQPATPPTPTPTPAPAYDPHTVHLGRPHPATPGPGTVPGPVPGPKPNSRALIWGVTLAVAVVVGGGAAAGVFVWQDRNGGDTSDKARTKPTATATASAKQKEAVTPPVTPSGAPTASAEPTPESTPESPTTPDSPAPAAQVPTGYHRLTDPLGFSFAVPEVWAREGVENGTQVTYAGSTGLEHIQVGVIEGAGYTSYDNFLTLEKTAERKNDNYRRIKLERNTFQERDGAVWEYTYTDGAGRTVHAKDQGYVAANGTEYAIMIVGHDDLWESGLAGTYQVALDTWQLT
ncbi:DUF6350 family protein [Streptomyces montanus]|uniref:cell division protein PerM n=1 Tax=Streptomyces montanus TaxID=2580423 RepID=UPI001FE6500A|nr:DUF6350 family protein [Streptomyces montanus]